MPYPDQFDYLVKSSEQAYSNSPPGALNVNQVIKSQPAWGSAASVGQKKHKTLILADWTISSWSAEKTREVQAALKKLLDEGFSVYLWQNHNLELLTKYTLNKLNEDDVKIAMTAAFSDELTKRASEQLKLEHGK